MTHCTFIPPARNLPAEDYKKVREGMIRCILATDMARHNEILSDFREIIPDFSFENRAHINVVCVTVSCMIM